MTKTFDKIRVGLDDARAYLEGNRSGFVVHDIEVSDPDVVAIRRRTGLSQPAFARSIASRSVLSRTGSRAVGDRRDRRACCSR